MQCSWKEDIRNKYKPVKFKVPQRYLQKTCIWKQNVRKITKKILNSSISVEKNLPQLTTCKECCICFYLSWLTTLFGKLKISLTNKSSYLCFYNFPKDMLQKIEVLTWAYLERAILWFSHWTDAAQRCIPVLAATCCQPRI